MCERCQGDNAAAIAEKKSYVRKDIKADLPSDREGQREVCKLLL